MKIIDTHMHLGEDLMFLTDDSEKVILDTMEANGVSAFMLQPGIVSRNQKKAHERIRRFLDANPGKGWGIAVFDPYLDEEKYFNLARWAVKDLGFKGLKLHPYAFCMSPQHPQADKIFRAAAELDVAVMIHTGNGVPNALPSQIIPVAKKYPKVRIVMAHAGGVMYGMEALITAEQCPNVYLETSWTAVYDLKAMTERVGVKRLMLGSDLPENTPVELAKYRSLKLKDSDLEWCFHKTAEKAFKL